MSEGRFEQELQELLDECNNLRRRWGESQDEFLRRQWRCEEEANHEAFRRRQQREREAQQAGAQNLLGLGTAMNQRDANLQRQMGEDEFSMKRSSSIQYLRILAMYPVHQKGKWQTTLQKM
jgi:hypothetical protein